MSEENHFAKWPSATLAAECKAQSQQQLDPEFSQFMIAVADRLSATQKEIDAIAKDRADWLLDAVACATQDRRFLRGDSAYDSIVGDAILANGEKAIRVALSRNDAGQVIK